MRSHERGQPSAKLAPASGTPPLNHAIPVSEAPPSATSVAGGSYAMGANNAIPRTGQRPRPVQPRASWTILTEIL